LKVPNFFETKKAGGDTTCTFHGFLDCDDCGKSEAKLVRYDRGRTFLLSAQMGAKTATRF